MPVLMLYERDLPKSAMVARGHVMSTPPMWRRHSGKPTRAVS
jgi:hypothetical protein